jgi:hypothetical protein
MIIPPESRRTIEIDAKPSDLLNGSVNHNWIGTSFYMSCDCFNKWGRKHQLVIKLVNCETTSADEAIRGSSNKYIAKSSIIIPYLQ